MEFIQLKGVKKYFKDQPIFDNVDFTIEEGDVVGLIGESGSGKTTLLNVISGFLPPCSGEVVYFSKIDHQPKDLHKNFSKIKNHIGFTHQHYSFYPHLTVKENILHFGHLYGLKKNIVIDNAKSILDFTGLYEHRNKIAEHLSGGMQRRLDISCSLIHKPKLLFLDEPTADLDPLKQDEIINLIKELNMQGVTIIIASHHLESLEKICNKIALIKSGKVTFYQNVEDIRKPFLKENVVINIQVGSDKEKIINLIKKLPLKKITDQGHQLVIEADRTDIALIALLKTIKNEELYLHDIDFRKPSLSEVFKEISCEEKNL